MTQTQRKALPADYPVPTSQIGGAIFLCILALPFLFLGSVLALSPFVPVLGMPRSDLGAGLFGCVFFLAGAGILALAWAMVRESSYERAHHAAFPNEPWKWKRHWADGMIRERSGAAPVIVWTIAIVWNLFTWIAIGDFASRGNVIRDVGDLVVPGLFVTVGVCLILWALTLTRRRLKFGRSVCQLETFPGVIGGWFAATIRAPGHLDSGANVLLTLSCVHRVVTGSGKHRHVREDVLWQDEQLLNCPPQRGMSGFEIPVAFQIPPGLEQTHPGASDGINWTLRSRADIPGADFAASFIVPVFETESPTQPPAAERAAAKLRAPAPSPSERAARGNFIYNSDAAGRVRLEFPPAQRPMSAAFTTLFAVGLLALLSSFHFPTLVEIIGWLVTLIFIYSALRQWLLSRRLIVYEDDVEIAWRMLVLGQTKRIPRRDITAVGYCITSQAGNRRRFKLQILVPGNKLRVSPSLKLDDAKWLAEQLRKTLDVPVTAVTTFSSMQSKTK